MIGDVVVFDGKIACSDRSSVFVNSLTFSAKIERDQRDTPKAKVFFTPEVCLAMQLHPTLRFEATDHPHGFCLPPRRTDWPT